jgi:hypothetical protein
MSGTAALAAARKRRANPQPTSGQFSQSNQSSSSSQSNQSNQSLNTIKEEIPKATNPTMLLMQHNVFIQKLQKDINEIKAENKANSEKPKGPETDYKEEYLGLLEEMKEMKKVLLKVQSFSMETNLEVMKLKRSFEKSDKSDKGDKSEKIDLSSITITNDIDEFV